MGNKIYRPVARLVEYLCISALKYTFLHNDWNLFNNIIK